MEAKRATVLTDWEAAEEMDEERGQEFLELFTDYASMPHLMTDELAMEMAKDYFAEIGYKVLDVSRFAMEEQYIWYLEDM